MASVTLRYKYLIRAQKFKELCYSIEKNKDLDQVPLALDYLQTKVTPLVDNEDDQERVTLARLCTRLCLLGDEGQARTWQRPAFLQQPSGKCDKNSPSPSIYTNVSLLDSFYLDRTHVYTELLEYFPADMREPTGDISDALQLH